MSRRARWLAVTAGVSAGILLAVANRPASRVQPVPFRAVASTAGPDLDGTVARARARLATDPGDAAAAVPLAEALLRKSRIEANGGYVVEAQRHLKAVLARDPGEYSALKMLGAVYLSQHRYRLAAETAARAIAIRDTDPWNYGVLGDAYVELGDYDRGFAAFDQMVRIRPNAASYARIAYAFELQGRLPEAVQQMRRAVEATGAHDPEALAWHHAQIGHLLFEMGNIDGAAREYAHANHVFPGYRYARLGRAAITAARGNVSAALDLYRGIMQDHPTADVAARIGDLLAESGDPAAAAQFYTTAETLERNNWRTEEPQPASLASMLAERDLKTEDAVRLAEQAAATRSDIATMDALAWAYFRAGRFTDAQSASERARRTGTRNRRTLYHAAAIADALGDRGGARLLLTRALEGHSTFDPVAAPAALALAAALGQDVQDAARRTSR